MRLLSTLFFGAIIMFSSFIVGIVFSLLVDEADDDVRYDY